MATEINLRPVEEVVGALFARDTDSSVDRTTSDSEEDDVILVEEPTFHNSEDAAAAAKSGDDGNCDDSEDDVGQPSKRRRTTSWTVRSTLTKNRPPGPTDEALTAISPIENWNLLFSDEILDEIVIHTNSDLSTKRSAAEIAPSYYHNLTREELKAFIGLLYFSGVQKTRDTNLEEMWSVTLGWSLYRATMTSKRFELLSRILRFDDRSTRSERRENDKFAAIRRVWEMFFQNCRKYYVPHESCIVEELLIPFRGRCPFKVCATTEAEKYGMKVFTLNDAQTFYVCNANPFVGKAHDLLEDNLSIGCVAKSASDSKTSTSECWRKMCQEFTTARRTARWPMRMWTAMLDLGGINAMILHNFNASNERLNRPKFLKTLAVNLVDEHLRQRMVVPSLRRDLRVVIEKILNVDMPTDYRRTNLLEKRTRCNLCPRDRDRKTRHACYSCRRPICDEHRASVCADCCSDD